MITHCPHCSKPLFETSIEREFTASEIERFWKRVDKLENGCWVFNRGHPTYGRLRIGGKRQLAHIASWKIHKGKIPAGRFVLHNCPSGDNPKCVNPDHLFIGTQQENMRDMIRKGRGAGLFGDNGSNTKLNSKIVLEIRELLHEKTETISEISTRLNVTFQCVYQIAIGNSWKSVGGHILIPSQVTPLTNEQVSEIRNAKNYRGLVNDLANKYEVHQSHISKIRNGTARIKKTTCISH